MEFLPRAVASVGALVVLDTRLLVVRHTYPPSQGVYMLPGGVVEAGEMLDAAVIREVAEETGIVARTVGVVGITSIVHQGRTHAYAVWLMEPTGGTLRADGEEVDHCCYLPFDELTEREDVSYLVKYLAARLGNGAIQVHTLAADYAEYVAGLTPESYRLYM